MVNRIWFALAIVGVLVVPAIYAADVSGIATESRYDLNDTSKVPTGIMSVPKNEIRRLPDMIDKPEAQIGMWVPMVEPAPVVRGFANRIGNNVRIYRNTGSTKDKYKYLVHVVSGADNNKWFIYRNVKYNWTFEDAGGEDREKSGGENGASGDSVWTPFYKASLAQTAGTYMRNLVNGTGAAKWDPKVFPNNHAKPFDSGISGDADTRGSTVLQEVGMLLTYERASVSPTSVSGGGYYGNADDSAIDPDSISVAQLNSDSGLTWEPSPTPAKIDGVNLEGGRGVGVFTAVNRVYVEDYKSPTVKATEVKIYRGNAGGFVEEVFEKASNSWKKVKGIVFEYEDDNDKADAASDRLKASMNYECGNMDLYKLENPYYNADDPTSDVYINFVYLSPTFKMKWNVSDSKWERIKISENPTKFDETIAYGPYVGPSKKSEEYDYYMHIDPKWSVKTPEEVEEFISSRYANAYDANWLAPWARGLCYFILDERNSGLLKTKLLNGYINKGKNTKNESLESKIPELDSMIKEYAELGDKGKKASRCLAAFKSHLAGGGLSDYNRFSYIEFKDGGRYCVGPIEFEKVGGTFSEAVVEQNGQKIKKGSWTALGPRVLMPKHFAVSSIEWDSTSGGRKSGEQMATDSQNFILGQDGKWHRTGTAADAGVPLELQVAGTNSNFIKKYGDDWMQKIPDLMFKVDMADCCGNTTNQVGFLKTEDGGDGTKPNAEVEISDSNGNDHIVGVPPQESTTAGDRLVVKDPKGDQSGEYAAGEYNGDNDLTEKEFTIDKSGRDQIDKEFSTDASDKAVGPPIGSDLSTGVKTIPEDTRLKIDARAWDNIDNFYKHRGISSYMMQIQELTKDGAPTGKYELLENESGAKAEKIANSVYDPPANGRLSQFNPDLKFYHIFRNPGLYRVEYTVEDVPFEGPPNKQNLFFRVRVDDTKNENRTIEDHQNRQ